MNEEIANNILLNFVIIIDVLSLLLSRSQDKSGSGMVILFLSFGFIPTSIYVLYLNFKFIFTLKKLLALFLFLAPLYVHEKDIFSNINIGILLLTCIPIVHSHVIYNLLIV